jgi:tetratricopeptide (TPR) repeat protein
LWQCLKNVIDIPNIAVVMIVRDEMGRVGRALSSVRDAVDTWLVIDTGSSDGTVDEIRTLTSGWSGHLIDHPWVNFGQNRTQLLEVAREMRLAKWLLTIDADHIVEAAETLRMVVDDAEKHGVDALLIPFTTVPKVWTIRLFRADLPWRYVGTTREYLTCDAPFKMDKIDAPRIQDLADGASRANKWRRDVEQLSEELKGFPEHARSWFYLGESYRGLEQHELAAIAYTNCALKTGSGEERYLALTMSGEMLVALGDVEGGLGRLLLANEGRPQRREALLIAVELLNKMKRHREVVKLLAGGPLTRPLPHGDATAILPEAYGPAMAHQLAVAKRHGPKPKR